VDQEGGQVRRLPDGPPSASAARLGQTLDAAGVAAEGRRTGAYLHRLGLSVDLAPVADVADARTSFLGSRVFGNDPDLVARLAPASPTCSPPRAPAPRFAPTSPLPTRGSPR